MWMSLHLIAAQISLDKHPRPEQVAEAVPPTRTITPFDD
jgi:hypothetical protein